MPNALHICELLTDMLADIDTPCEQHGGPAVTFTSMLYGFTDTSANSSRYFNMIDKHVSAGDCAFACTTAPTTTTGTLVSAVHNELTFPPLTDEARAL